MIFSDDYRPLARQTELVVQEVAGDMLAYDTQTNQAHCLSPRAAEIWGMCDGQATVREIAARLGTPAPLSEDVVWMALDYLHQAGMLARPLPSEWRRGYSRRRMMKNLIQAAVALPVVASVLVPSPAAAGSKCENLTGGNTCAKPGDPTLGTCYRGGTSCDPGVKNQDIVNNLTCDNCDSQALASPNCKSATCTCLPGGGFNNCSWEPN